MIFDKDKTLSWWNRLLDDRAAMDRWLIKLYGTELDGYYDNLAFLKRFQPEKELHRRIFLKTAQDELRHATLLLDLLLDRGHEDLSTDQSSVYWDVMYEGITDLQSAAAVLYHGEKLAADRFEVIGNHPKTPSDIKYFLDQATPDEKFHAASFKAIAGADAIKKATELHETALKALAHGR